MTNSIAPAWQTMGTDETRLIEKVLVEAGFKQVEANRFNSATIRARVIDSQLDGLWNIELEDPSPSMLWSSR